MKQLVLKSSLVLNAVLLACIVFFAFFNKAPETTKAKNESQVVNIVHFGDSRVAEGDWNKILGREDVKNSGFRGFTSSHLRWIVKESVLDYQPKICILEVGVNDLGAGIPMQRIQLNYKKLVATLKEHKIVPIIQSVVYQENNPKSTKRIQKLNAFLHTFCKENTIHFLDINATLSNAKGLKKEYSRDGTHFTSKGYQVWGEQILQVLKKVE